MYIVTYKFTTIKGHIFRDEKDIHLQDPDIRRGLKLLCTQEYLDELEDYDEILELKERDVTCAKCKRIVRLYQDMYQDIKL